MVSPAAADQSTIINQTICDGNGVSWDDGGTTPASKSKIYLEFEFNYYIFAFELNNAYDCKEQNQGDAGRDGAFRQVAGRAAGQERGHRVKVVHQHLSAGPSDTGRHSRTAEV